MGIFKEARDPALFHITARTSARLPPQLPDVSLSAASNPNKIYPTVKEAGSFVLQELLRVYATSPTDLSCFCNGSIDYSAGREGKPHARLFIHPTDSRDSWGHCATYTGIYNVNGRLLRSQNGGIYSRRR